MIFLIKKYEYILATTVLLSILCFIMMWCSKINWINLPKKFFDDSCTFKYFLSSGTYTPKQKVAQRILFVVHFENFGRANNTSNGSALIQILWSNEYLKIHFGVNASYYCIFFVKWTITSFASCGVDGLVYLPFQIFHAIYFLPIIYSLNQN